jgi:hypothetical protein
LAYLHGESSKTKWAFSNQMPHTICPKPGYCIKYWTKHELQAPERDVFSILRNRAQFRLEHDGPKTKGLVKKGDVRNAGKLFAKWKNRVSLFITSPPYLDVTNYEEDQWLRLWFLGGLPQPTYGTHGGDDRHKQADRYFKFLCDAWKGISTLAKPDSHLVCRIGTNKLTAEELAETVTSSVTSAWATASLVHSVHPDPMQRKQTGSFLPKATGCKEEYDFVFHLR